MFGALKTVFKSCMSVAIRLALVVKDMLTTMFFRIDAFMHPNTVPQNGITIVAHLTGAWSFGKVMRDLAFSLKEAGIPFQTFNIGMRKDIPAEDVDPILTPRCKFRIKKYNHVIDIVSSPVPDNIPGVKRSTVFFWEFDTGFLESWPTAQTCQSAIAFSDFNHHVFRKALPSACDVHKILYPFRFNISRVEKTDVIRDRYGIPQDAFAVFFNFSYSSGIGRKNPEGVIRAFAKAFKNDSQARLVFKTMAASQSKEKVERLKRLAESEGVLDRIISIDRYVPQNDIYGITAACDVYISLHRGEGFGLGVAEAMSLGKPVVVTDYSSTTEFCNKENSCLIPYRMVKPTPDQLDCDTFRHVFVWPEPDIDVAADMLTRLRKDANFRETLGRNAQSYMSDHFSLERFRKSILEFIKS